MPPHFRPANAALNCEKETVRWPGPFGSGFLSPQPPGIVRIGPVALQPEPRTDESWSFFICGDASALPPILVPPRRIESIPNHRMDWGQCRDV